MQQELRVAISHNNAIRVKQLLDSGCDANYVETDENGSRTTYLHLANDATITKELLNHGANVEAINEKLQTPLSYSIYVRKGLHVIRELLDFQPNLNEEAAYLMTVGIRCEHIDVVYELINRIAVPILTQFFGIWEYRPCYFTSTPTYEKAYQLFSEKLKPIWKQDIWRLLHAEEKYIQYNIQSFIFFRKNGYVQRCFEEILKMKRFRVCNMLIPDLLKLPVNITKGTRQFNRKEFAEIKMTFPIYGVIVIKCVEKFIKRRMLLKKLDNIIFTQRKCGENKRVHMNRYCLMEIAEYLENESLENFSTALNR